MQQADGDVLSFGKDQGVSFLVTQVSTSRCNGCHGTISQVSHTYPSGDMVMEGTHDNEVCMQPFEII